ncbi:acyl-CoA dehydrogenase family protein [Spelaeicoccus albus]|uniref:Putative acyl-CoA dehydrogenase n=1 Tax=Spelaeicoccus albus TaxID=1280376 RepID=A0A7Z0D3K8_9MICO|nr:acyl-CoA dehydrogenase family protein [Spelaeicoccus albus]NYI68206.1 putative acyl-CoA dehydrogenase [Spelaeicoccus albus]
MSRGGHIRQTHAVTNQPPPRTGVNEFTASSALVEGVKALDAGWDADRLTEIGAHVGSAEFQDHARRAQTRPPVLRTHDKWGNRIDEVDYDPSYHSVIADAVRYGAHTSAWAEPGPGATVARAAAFMLFAQIEPGHACPISMTHAAVASLQHAPSLAEAWMPRLLSRHYSPELSAAKPGALIGMAMTEKQGGSDVRANTTRAVDAGGTYELTGHKWFCSAPMSDAFLVLAQTGDPGSGTARPSCFLVPRLTPDGERNPFRIQRLKDKLGNRSNASAEVEFDGTLGALVGEEGRGVRAIIDMVSRTRLDCVLGSAAGMRQAVAEALWHTRSRTAFGARLVDQPAMTAVLADLALEAEAATLTGLVLARAHDNDADDESAAFRRLAVPVAKYWITKRGPGHAYEALECLGGNGYTEDFPLAMRYREQPVMAVWEGSGNVMALDVLRALARDENAVEAFGAYLGATAGVYADYDAELEHMKTMLAAVGKSTSEGDAAALARPLTASMAVLLQAAVMLKLAPSPVAEAFIGARLVPNRTGLYGALPRGLDLAAVLERS